MSSEVFTTDKIEIVRKALSTCTMCGFCKSVCPSFKAINTDTDLSRGRIVMTYGLAMGDLEPTPDLIGSMYTCTTCADCVRRCPSKVPIVDIIEMARADIVANGGMMDKHRKMCENILKYNNPYAEPESVAKTLGLEVHPAPVAYFAGCTAAYRTVKTARATISILEKLGADFTILDEVCCGSVMQRVGWPIEDMLANMKTNVDRIAALGVKTLVLSCAGCYRMFKIEYPKHIEVPFEVLHMSEFLEREGVSMTSLGDRKVTYHDPCHLGRHCGIYDAPRKVIGAFDGVDFEEMKYSRELSHCCGGGGGVRSGYPEISASIAGTRVDEAEELGADLLVTTCPFCVNNLKDQVEDDMEVVDLVELVDEHLVAKSQ